MKTMIPRFFIVLLLLLSTSCSHEHDPSGWMADRENHWQVCKDDGEKLNSGTHTLDETAFCSVCNHTICNYDDGTYDILSYDAMGSLCLSEYYDAEDSLLSRTRYETEYDENGNPKASYEYLMDVALNDGEEMLICEDHYEPCTNPELGDVYLAESISYSEDGSKTVAAFTESFNLLTYVSYNPDGNVITAEKYEYEYDEAGNQTYQALYIDEVLNYEYFYTEDPEVGYYMSREVYYDENGSVISDTSYDISGEILE